MNSLVKKLINNKKIIWGVKVIFCLLVVVCLFNNFFIKGIDNYASYKDYFCLNDCSENACGTGVKCIEQHFNAKGNILSNISLYFEEVTDQEICITVVNDDQKVIVEKNINLKNYNANSWNKIAMNCNDLKRDGQYIISIKGDNLSSIVLRSTNTNPDIFTGCSVNGNDVTFTLAIGLQFTYKYMTLGQILELMANILFILAIAVVLCFTILKFERVYNIFVQSEKKKGFLYALYFSVYTVFLFNPLETIRNEVDKFGRVIGPALNAGIDVSKRINNFNHWFIYFAIVFILFFIWANYFKSKEISEESKKVADLLDNIIVIANAVLGLRCITFFYDRSQDASVFYYSDYFIMLIILLATAYILLDLDTKISVESIESMLFSGWMIALPVSIVISHDWALGKVFMGVQVLISVAIILSVRFFEIEWNGVGISSGFNTCAAFMSLIPLFTSFYIEFITLLNQHRIFWIHIKRNYFCAIVIGIITISAIAFVLIKRDKNITNWKVFAYPSAIFGFACLWQQIPITAAYKAHIFEEANSSILISDFLNFGDIPIVQHYGGHMMFSVWEGLIYAILNNDYAGAVFSPYSGYIAVVITIVFFLLVKYIWNEDAAVLVTLFFPFYNSIAYWGLGILMALTAMAYVRKNTYFRAALFWFTSIWCVIYRLDLGFAFAVAGMITFLIYVCAEKNFAALKQLAFTLLFWGIVGGTIWFGICSFKGIDPVKRLIELLMISLSNQNWAYLNIGDTSSTKFAFTYIIIPFWCILLLLYTIFVKKIKANLGTEQWILILILGFSYFINYSRGLVRHSLAENDLNLCLWTAPLFITLFIISFTRRKRIFLPVFMSYILLYTLFLTEDNFMENSIADAATGKVGTYTESWTLSRFAEEETPDDKIAMTYWRKLYENKEVIERVEWDEDLRQTVENYRTMIDALLEEDETFVDCINKTSIYPLLGRQDPVYISQSPLQLSGQYTQERFIEEIKGIPIILMPYDSENERASEALDDVPNSYRYYKVFEYIYQNYVPLCTYENIYSIWCLPERYNKMASKVARIKEGTDIKLSISLADNLQLNSVEIIKNEDDSININATGVDPTVGELQNLIDLTPYVNRDFNIVVEYETDTLTEMKVFYTTDNGENYTPDKVSTYKLTEKSGKAYFKIPVSEYTRIRFDIPDGGRVKIKSFVVGSYNCKLAAYGYDGPYLSEDGVKYLPYVHNYDLSKLPAIWAEDDKRNSVENSLLTTLLYDNGMYRYDLDTRDYGLDGNYLKVSLDYDGLDQYGDIDIDDETVDATIKVGKIFDGQFETKYIYTFTVIEGQHDYLFRISNDYYWYLDETDSILLECEDQLVNVNMEILEGD